MAGGCNWMILRSFPSLIILWFYPFKNKSRFSIWRSGILCTAASIKSAQMKVLLLKARLSSQGRSTLQGCRLTVRVCSVAPGPSFITPALFVFPTRNLEPGGDSGGAPPPAGREAGTKHPCLVCHHPPHANWLHYIDCDVALLHLQHPACYDKWKPKRMSYHCRRLLYAGKVLIWFTGPEKTLLFLPFSCSLYWRNVPSVMLLFLIQVAQLCYFLS